jgi:uncharacterized protein YjiS (DUF1127 family)
MITMRLMAAALRGLGRTPRGTRTTRTRAGAELQAMSDHELKDLGIGRSEIAYVLDAAEAARRPGGARSPTRVGALEAGR